MRIDRFCCCLIALALLVMVGPHGVASEAPGECTAAAVDSTPDQVIEALTDQGLDIEPVSGGGGDHPICPFPRSCGDQCVAGVCGPLVFPRQCVQQDLGDNRCKLGGRTIKVCPNGQTIRTSTCECEDVSPCVCGNRVIVSCQ